MGKRLIVVEFWVSFRRIVLQMIALYLYFVLQITKKNEYLNIVEMEINWA